MSIRPNWETGGTGAFITGEGSGKPTRRGSVGHQPAQALSPGGQAPVGGVDHGRQPERIEQPAERAGERQLREQPHPAALVAGDGGAVLEDQPPALAALLLVDALEEPLGFVVGEPNQGQRPSSVQRGDDPRRPAAEPSATGVEQHRALEW